MTDGMGKIICCLMLWKDGNEQLARDALCHGVLLRAKACGIILCWGPLQIYIYIYIYLYIYIYTCEPMSPCTSLYRVQPIPSRPFSFTTVGSKLGHFFAQHLGFFKVESTQLVDQMLCFQIYWEPTIFGEIHIRHW